ncbi:polyamine transporter 1 [Daldinia caldariorum]|uniref:polyamine transporter 1 n=1 Tax=Daldinia caldariorum TaxID=326644 RepID=UPI0020089594|nr:polyamine transporter 1 [Daldinia caldariorum]KAI1470869.1 polyamine transporter 1 [Daldinia caldariorum]
MSMADDDEEFKHPRKASPGAPKPDGNSPATEPDFDSSCDCPPSEKFHDGHRPCTFDTRPSQTHVSGRDGSHGLSVASRIWHRPELLPFHHQRAKDKTGEESLVDFDGPDDPYRPVNWPRRKKLLTTLLYALVTMSATWASASYSPGTRQVAEQFGVGRQTATLGTTLFLLGFGIGPLLWAPLSEVYGRRPAVLTPMFVSICFVFGSATAKDFHTLILTRFWAAIFASAPVANTGGVLGDLYTPAYRGIAMAGSAMAIVSGPTVGPIVSAAVVAQPNLGWRWTGYTTGILQSVILILAVIFIDESYPPKLLVAKAKRLRLETGNWALHAKFEEWDINIVELMRKFLIRPIQLLCTPICFLVALYASLCYGILYMQLGAVPIIFGEIRGWPLVSSALPFLAICVGSFTGAAINMINQLYYNKAYRASGGRPVPEKRLPPMMLGSVLFTAGQFITGWTAAPDVAPWIVPVAGLYLAGCGFSTIFQAALNYLVETFQMYAASAIAANTFLRSCFAAALPLVVTPLYRNIGVGPGASIFAGFSCLLVPVPFVFYFFGRRIRAANKWSKHSVF